MRPRPRAFCLIKNTAGLKVRNNLTTISASPRIQVARLLAVIVLTAGLLVSMLQCATCGFEIVAGGDTILMASNDGGSSPDKPDRLLPCHGGHCLSHVAQPAFVVASQAHFPPGVHDVHQERLPMPLASLQFFKPPRA